MGRSTETNNNLVNSALEHMASQNEHLVNELADAREMLTVHKKLLEEALDTQNAKVKSCAQSGTKLLGRCQDQAEYLKANRQMLDTSQISMLTTMDEIGASMANPVDLAAFRPIK